MTEEQKKKVIATAQSYLGTPYARGTAEADAKTGIDCSLLAQLAYQSAGIEIGRSSILQAADAKGTEIEMLQDFSNLETGDLIFFRSDRGFYDDERFNGRKLHIGHVVIYLGQGNIIHSRSARGGVCVESLRELTQNPNYAIVMVKRF